MRPPPERVVQLTSPIELMRFTLTYRGRLPAEGRESRVNEKHAIRRYLHAQLWDLWRSRPVLRRELNEWLAFKDLDARRNWENEQSPWEEPKHTLKSFQRGPYTFLPLVSRHFDLICDLDILFLRAEPPGMIFGTNEAGDLDNRLKTLFDALQVPTEVNQLPKRPAPDDPACDQPFFCLLENDRLITTLRVESERLLDVTEETKNCVELVIRVVVKSERISYHNLDIVGDA